MAARSARLALGGCAAVLALAACSAGPSTNSKHASPAASRSSPGTSGPAAPAAAPVSTVIAGQPGAPPKIPGALSPAQLIAAYDVGPLLSRGITGKGQTIVIIDPLGSPTIDQDLATYDKAWHLPAPPSFRIVAPAGPVPPYRPTRAQFEIAVETTMDVEAAHLMAPGAGLVLVEIPADWAVPRAGLPSLVRAAQYVIRHHLGSVISMSLGATETWFPVARAHRALLRAGLAHPMITMVAGSGDTGAAGATRDYRHVYPTPRVGWPASDPRVVAVGGTRLELGLQAASMAVAPATAWPRSGGGRSAVFPRPAYQRTVPGLAGRWRMIPDISLDAAGLSRLEIYAIPLGGTKWDATYGTSLAAPLFAGVVALADQAAGRPLGNINPLLYRLAAQHDPGIVDVRGPGNTFRFGGAAVRGFPAGPGYDLVTGLGTIDAAKFVPDLARLARQGPG